MRYRYEDLEVGQKVLDFIKIIYLFTTPFPQDERFALVSQLRRAANSVYLNIAEGSARKSPAEMRRFVTIALGSLVECHAGLKIALQQGYIAPDQWQTVQPFIETIWFKLCALRDSQR